MSNIRIYEKSIIDLDNVNPTFTVTDAVADDTGQSIINSIRDRSNSTAWLTTSSTDAANTKLVIDLLDALPVSKIIMILHNFFAYTFKYHDGSSFVDFVPAINETANLSETQYHSFEEVTASQFELIITQCFLEGASVVDADKILRQLIFTREIDQFADQPDINKLRQNKNRRSKRMVSGKINVTKRAGAVEATLQFKPTKNKTTIKLLDTIFGSDDGILWSFIGADETGHDDIQGFRLEDLYLMAATNEFDTQYFEGYFNRGHDFKLELIESDG